MQKVKRWFMKRSRHLSKVELRSWFLIPSRTAYSTSSPGSWLWKKETSSPPGITNSSLRHARSIIAFTILHPEWLEKLHKHQSRMTFHVLDLNAVALFSPISWRIWETFLLNNLFRGWNTRQAHSSLAVSMLPTGNKFLQAAAQRKCLSIHCLQQGYPDFVSCWEFLLADLLLFRHTPCISVFPLIGGSGRLEWFCDFHLFHFRRSQDLRFDPCRPIDQRMCFVGQE